MLTLSDVVYHLERTVSFDYVCTVCESEVGVRGSNMRRGCSARRSSCPVLSQERRTEVSIKPRPRSTDHRRHRITNPGTTSPRSKHPRGDSQVSVLYSPILDEHHQESLDSYGRIARKYLQISQGLRQSTRCCPSDQASSKPRPLDLFDVTRDKPRTTGTVVTHSC